MYLAETICSLMPEEYKLLRKESIRFYAAMSLDYDIKVTLQKHSPTYISIRAKSQVLRT